MGLGRKGRVLAVVALGVAMALPWSPARAEPEPGGWTVAGRITDLAGRVIVGSYVTDGYVRAAADSAGNYRLDLDAQWVGWAHIRAGGGGVRTESQRQVYRTEDTEHVDFQLKFSIGAYIQPLSLPDPISKAHITAYSSMPSTDCVYAIDPASQERVPLALESTGWSNRWSGDIPIDPATPPGLYAVEVLNATCDTGIELGDRARAHYLIDRAAPTVEITSPGPGRVVIDDIDVAPSPDGVTSAVGAMRIALRAADDAALSSASIELRTMDGNVFDRCYLRSVSPKRTVTGSCRFIDPGDFVATAVAQDSNGNEVRSVPLRIQIT